MAGYDSMEDMVGQLVYEVQMHVYPRRMRCTEFFRDFDHLRCGRCTLPQFSRCLGNLGLVFTEEQIKALAEHFTDYSAQKPQNVHYAKFCAAVDEVFASCESPAQHMMSSSPSSTMLATFKPNSVEDEDQVTHVLHRLAVLCKTRGIVFKYCFTDFDRAPIASPSRMNPRGGGKVTAGQFRRLFPFKKEFDPQDVDILVARYGTEKGDVHFQAMHNDISEVMSTEMQPFPTSDLILRPDDTVWSHMHIEAVRRVQSKVVEKRVRLKEFFQDFDPLRKGVCTVGQVKTVFTILNVGKEITRQDFEELVSQYVREDGLFCYSKLCSDVDEAFATPNLEKDPLMQSQMPDADTTAPARRNTITLSREKRELVHKLEEKIRTRIQTRRILIKPIFQDMDRAHRGFISKNQFTRSMQTLGFDLDEVSVGLLAGVYCNLGTHLDFNYVDFCKSCDPHSEDVEIAMQQAIAPPSESGPSKYFDTRGKVIPRNPHMVSPVF